ERWVTELGGGVLYSANAGATWERRSTVPQEAHAIFGVDRDHLWVVGDNCVLQGTSVYRSTDGAKTWTATKLDDVYCLNDVWASDAQHVWAIGNRLYPAELASHALVVKSDDSGATWAQYDLKFGDG